MVKILNSLAYGHLSFKRDKESVKCHLHLIKGPKWRRSEVKFRCHYKCDSPLNAHCSHRYIRFLLRPVTQYGPPKWRGFHVSCLKSNPTIPFKNPSYVVKVASDYHCMVLTTWQPPGRNKHIIDLQIRLNNRVSYEVNTWEAFNNLFKWQICCDQK